MRVGSVLLFKDGLCYQSYNWEILRPLGDLQNALDLLEGYGCDEVSIIRPIRQQDTSLENDLKLIKNIKTMTPLSFGGGLRTISSLKLLSDLPVERYVFSSSIINQKKNFVEKAISLFGRQAIQVLLPFKKIGNELFFFLSSENKFIKLSKKQIEYINNYANEIILYDVENEGIKDKFDLSILDFFNFSQDKIIISGGIGPFTTKQASKLQIASSLIDNRTLHNEFSIRGYR